MNRSPSPTIDTTDLARTAARVEGEAEIAQLPRLAEVLLRSEGVLRYRVQGRLTDDGHPGASLHVKGDLLLSCQRCNQPLVFALDRTTDFRFVRDESELNALPIEDDEIDHMIGSRALPLLPWIEEEAMLSLPLVPRHSDCRLPIAEAPALPGRASPFAVLGDLLPQDGTPAAVENDDAGDGEGEEAAGNPRRRR